MSDAEEKKNGNATDSSDQASTAPGAVKKGGWLVFGLIICSLLWYLVADRYTPYTKQARVQGYVVGVAPQVSGIVTEIWTKNNQEVKEGEQLFRINPSQYEIALEKARSDLENTMRQVEAGDAAVKSARANLSAALANQTKAEKDTRRLERLRKEDPGTISTRRVEISRANLDSAKAKVAAAEASIQQAVEKKGGEDREDNSLLKVAFTAVKKAELDLERTIVKAPSRGVITDLRADVGVYAGAGTPVMTLVAVKDVWVRAEYTENNLGRITPGTPVEIIFDIFPGRVYQGTISSIGLGVSSGQAPAPGTLPTIDNDRDWLRQSQRFPVYVHFDSAQYPDLTAKLRIGGQASVVAYGEGSGFIAWLAKIHIRLVSFFSYAY